MSTPDTMISFLSTPWVDAHGKTLAVRALPGLAPDLIDALKKAYPGVISPQLQALLAISCGLADTDLGSVDFTGCQFPEEPCGVFAPCLTLAIDDGGRRWIAEVGNGALPGPVWCVFPDPEVALYVSDDLGAFVATLREQAVQGGTLAWLQSLSASAKAIWIRRRALALRPSSIYDPDRQIRAWLSTLPIDAYVYDLRRRSLVRGWPYGVAGPSGKLYRCGRLPVFAVATSPSEGWRVRNPDTAAPVKPLAALALDLPAKSDHANRPRRRVLRPDRSTRPADPPAELRLCA